MNEWDFIVIEPEEQLELFYSTTCPIQFTEGLAATVWCSHSYGFNKLTLSGLSLKMTTWYFP